MYSLFSLLHFFSTVSIETVEAMLKQIPHMCPCSGMMGRNSEQDSSFPGIRVKF